MTGTLSRHSIDIRRTEQLVGRDDAQSRAVWSLMSGTARMVLVTGPAGIGRTVLLQQVRDALERQRMRTAHVPLLRGDHNRPQAVIARLREERARWPHRPPVLFLDDLHRLNRDVLCALVEELARLGARVVGSYRTPVLAEHTALVQVLRSSAFIEMVALAPLNRADVSRMFTGLLDVSACPDLVRTLHNDSRGVPGLVDLAVDGYLRGSALRVVDRTAYLIDRRHGNDQRHPAVERIRLLGDTAWRAAKAMAVLHPLGPAAEELVGDTTALPELEAEGLLVRRKDGWRFRAPVLAHALAARLGPYERQDLGWRAVSALWEGRVTCADPDYLPDRLIDAGDFADAGRAYADLLAAGTAAVAHDRSARRWLLAAADRAVDQRGRAYALFMYAATCAYHNDYAAAMDSINAALEHTDGFSANQLQELHLLRLVGLCAAGDRRALHEFVDSGWRSLPGGPPAKLVGRAVALCYVDRWDEAATLLAGTRGTWTCGTDATVSFGEIYAMGASLMTGRMADFERLLSDPGLCPLFEVERHRPALIEALARALLVAGEANRASRILAGHGTTPDLALLAAAEGRWDTALTHARQALVSGGMLGHVQPHTALRCELAVMLTAHAKLTRARDVLAQGRATQNVVPHLLDAPEADLELVLGAREMSRTVLLRGLAFAEQHALVLGTDELHLRMVMLALGDGDRADAEQRVQRMAGIAATMDTGRAHRNHLLARAVTWHEESIAEEVRRLVAERGQPFETAVTLSTLALHGLGDGRTLREAYDLFGALDALLPRALLRHVMRERGIAVAGRAATTAEQERLLASLVADGLTNRELAVVLHATEKSVEAKLTRLFQRTGCRSRVELATAMLTGEYR